MEQVNQAMEFAARIDISEIIELKACLAALPINSPQQVICASQVTHSDSASYQLLYAYMQFLQTQDSTLVISQPSEVFTAHAKMLGFDSYFNYT